MAYCTATDVRNVTNLTTEDISDADITEIIKHATAELNHAINSKIIEEEVSYIDEWRQNKIDGSNTTFYVQKCVNWFLGDMDNDGAVTTADIHVREYKYDNTWADLTVSSVAPNDGKFIVTTPPAPDSRLKITYVYAPVSESDPHFLIKQACTYLAASLCFLKIQSRDFKRISLGRLSTYNVPKAFDLYYAKYQQILNKLHTRISRRVLAEKLGRHPLPEYQK